MKNLLQEKSYNFSLRIVRLSEYLSNEKREFVISRKLLDSGINISLFIEEAQQALEKSDFIQKYSLSNKEAFKTNLLLRLLRDSEFVTEAQAESLLTDCEELQKLLISSLRTARKHESL